jgi:hypothetical protein
VTTVINIPFNCEANTIAYAAAVVIANSDHDPKMRPGLFRFRALPGGLTLGDFAKPFGEAVQQKKAKKAKVLDPDREQLSTFITTMFKHASTGTWVSLRSFYDKDRKAFKIEPHKLNGHFDILIDKACHVAKLAANASEKIVFSTPIATFDKRYWAAEEDLAEGLAISAEIDKRAQEGRAKLEELLGPATVVVESGGEWVDGETGEVLPRLHTHHRLKAAARGDDQLAKLKYARKLATAIVGADTSNVTIVHPIRWPGSWHRKKQPRLCRIVSINPDAEIDLDEALEILKKAAPEVEEPAQTTTPIEGKWADPDLIFAAMEVVPNRGVLDGDEDEWNEWNNTGMAIWLATKGVSRGFEAFDMWSRKSPKYKKEKTKERWQHYFGHPPNKIGAGSIIAWANEAEPGWREVYEEQQEQEMYKSFADAKKAREKESGEQQQEQSTKQKAAKPQQKQVVVEPVDL